jgi:hypothetical protein
MQTSQHWPSSTKQFEQSRGKLILALGITSLSLVPGEIVLINILSRLFSLDSVVKLFVGITLLAPIFGLTAWFMANKELRKIRDGIVSPTARGLVKKGRFLGIFGLVLFAILTLLYSQFPDRSVGSYRDAMINDFNNLSAHAYQYRIRSLERGGGGGSYEGYRIPQAMAESEDGIYTVTAVHRDSVILHGKAKQVEGTIDVTVDPGGHPILWIYGGGFK